MVPDPGGDLCCVGFPQGHRNLRSIAQHLGALCRSRPAGVAADRHHRIADRRFHRQPAGEFEWRQAQGIRDQHPAAVYVLRRLPLELRRARQLYLCELEYRISDRGERQHLGPCAAGRAVETGGERDALL